MQPRPYQSAAIESTLSWAKYKETPAIIVLPTGSGKTIVIKYLIEHFYAQGKRILLLAHRKELLQQSGNHLDVPFSYYSASLGSKDRLDDQVTIAGIQSIYDKQTLPYDIILVDECHRISNSKEGQYWTLLEKHPQAKLIALTATPHRLKGGALEWGQIIYDIGYKPLIDEGYLCPPVNKVSVSPELANVPIKLGDYITGKLEEVMLDADLMRSAVAKIKYYTPARNSVLIFCVSIAHADLLKEALILNDMQAEMVSGDTAGADRDDIIERFKSGSLKYLINVELLLEGFDMPSLDCIVCLRPTQSKVLWQQMMGRGVRPCEGKKDFLLLDMAGNLQEHGGLGNPIKEKARREKKQKIGRICPVCESFLEGSGIKECPDCAYAFPEAVAPKVGHNHRVDTHSHTIYDAEREGQIEEYEVIGVSYREHLNKKKGTISIRIDYECPGAGKYSEVSEWLAVHSTSDFARNKCYNFYRERGIRLIADTKEYQMFELLDRAKEMRVPLRITVDYSSEFPRVIKYTWSDAAEEPVKSNRELLDNDEIPFY